jgi:hypothetical protein
VGTSIRHAAREAARHQRSKTAGVIHICVRKTLDWRNEALADASILPEFRAKYEMWNATFDMPYAAFRQRVKEIAELSLSRVVGARRTSLGEVPPGELIVPVDDDDWFAPNLANEIRRLFDPDASGYRWRRDVVEPLPGGSRIRSWWVRNRELERLTCASNNYAIVNTPRLTALVSNHLRASEYFDAHPAELRRTTKVLGIQNRSPASQTALAWRRPTISRGELIETLERYRGLHGSWKLGRALRWAAPYLRATADLIDELRVRE